MPLTTIELRNHVKRRLGAGRVIIELDDEHLDEVRDEALRTYSRYKPVVRHSAFQLVPGQTIYVLPSDAVGHGVFEVVPEPIDTGTLPATGEIDEFSLRYRGTSAGLTGIVLDRVNHEMLGRVSSSDFDWSYDHLTRKVFVTPAPNSARPAAYRYFDDPDLIEVPREDEDWFYRYMLAGSREILAEIRGKYEGIPGNTVSPNSNADAQRQRAEVELDALREEIMLRRADAWMLPEIG